MSTEAPARIVAPAPAMAAIDGIGSSGRGAALARRIVTRVAAVGAVVAVLLAVWAGVIAVFDIEPYFMPGPFETLGAIVEHRADLVSHARVTMWETLVGVVVATVFALVLAVAFVTSAHLERALLPLAITLRSIPIVAIAPLITLIVGRGFATSIVCVTIVCFFPVLVNAGRGMRAVSGEMRELLRVCGASRRQALRFVRFPVMTPYLFAGLRSAAAVAVLAAMLAEWLTGQQGLGYLLIDAVALRDNELLWAVVIVSASCSLLFFATMQALEKALVNWALGGQR